MDYEDELERMKVRRGRAPQYRQKTVSNDRNSKNSSKKINKKSKAYKKRRRKRRLLLAEIILLALILLGAYFYFGNKTNVEGYWTVAIFGVDSRDGKLGKGTLSDVIMICSINKGTGEMKLVSVFRDTYLEIDQKGTYHKINEAYMKGGYEQAVAALNQNLDLNIDDYATFNWKAVADTINILGGVDIDITDAEFKYINSFITETVNSTGIGSYQLASAGPNHLDGVQAVAYARLRLMDTDFNRTERQRKVVFLALEKAKAADFAVLNNILVTVLPQVKTSVGLSELLPMAQGVHKYHLGETGGFPFSRTTKRIEKRDCVIPSTLESNVIQLHEFLYGDTEYIPSSTVQRISKKIAEVSGVTQPGKNAPSGGGGDSSGTSGTAQTTPRETDSLELIQTEETTVMETTEAEAVESTTSQIENIEESTIHSTNEDGSLVGPGSETREPESSEYEPEEVIIGPGLD